MAFLSTITWVFSLYPSWHAPSGSNSSLLLLGGKSSQQDIAPKESKQEPQNRLFILPTARLYTLLPLTHNPPLLYWLGTVWWYLCLVRALVLCTSKACPLLMHLSWSGSSSVHSATHPRPLMAWTVFWFLIPYGLLFSRARLCLIVGFSFFNLLFCSFRGLATIPTMLLCYSSWGVIWPQLARPLLGRLRIPLLIGYNDLVWSLDLYSCYFGLSWPITLLMGSFVPFLSSLGILGPFAFLGHPLLIF